MSALKWGDVRTTYLSTMWISTLHLDSFDSCWVLINLASIEIWRDKIHRTLEVAFCLLPYVWCKCWMFMSQKRLSKVLGKKKISLRVIKHTEATSSIEVPKAQMAGGCDYPKVWDMASILTELDTCLHSFPVRNRTWARQSHYEWSLMTINRG